MTNQTQITVHFSFRQWDNRNELLVKEIVSQPKELVEDPDGIQDRPQTRLYLCARGQIPLLDLNMFVFFFNFNLIELVLKGFTLHCTFVQFIIVHWSPHKNVFTDRTLLVLQDDT